MTDAYLWYDDASPGLGESFLDVVQAGLTKLQGNPYIYSSISQFFRKAKTSRFPYLILYEIEGNSIFVTSIWHTSRKPRR